MAESEPAYWGKETYLGDGLYVSFDGFQFVLRAPRVDGDHWVGLDPDVLIAFTDYVRRTLEEPLPDQQS